MNYDNYKLRMQSIHAELEAIAKQTFYKALVNSADYSNPDFVTLMKKHQKLTDESAQLTQKMLEHLGHS